MKEMRRHRICLLFIMIFIMLISSYGMVWAEDGGEEVIRVGYPTQAGLTEITPQGSYRGYTYDYLREISQYTNWQYEFVTPEGSLDEQLSILLKMLQDGEIDILGSMNYSDQLAEMFSYSGYNYGTAYSTLAVLQDNTKFTDFNYSTFDNIRVSVVSGSGKRSEKLDEFAKMNGFRVQQIICKSEQEEMELLESGQADAALRMDVGDYEINLRVIARMDPKPFYFAVTKGRQEIVTGLNQALEMINIANPYFGTQLYEQYFSRDTDMILSDKEQEYVEKNPTLKAAFMLGKAPFQYRARDGSTQGISYEVLQHISEETGFKFDMMEFENYGGFSEALRSGEVDIVMGVVSNYELAQEENYAMTSPYAHVPLMLAMNKKCENPSVLKGKRLALTRGNYYEGAYAGTVTSYDTIEDCLDAVHKGTADYTYGNGYSIQYYVNNKSYNNITMIAQSETWSQKFCIGIMKPADITLLSILNKAIKNLPDDVASQYLYEKVYDADGMSLVDYMRRNPREIVLVLVSLALTCALAGILIAEYSRRVNAARKALENERYEQLSELANEYLYEYDIKNDCLKLTEQTAHFLGREREIHHPGNEQADVFHYMISERDSSAEHECTMQDGGNCWVRIVLKIISDKMGKPWYAVGKLIDIREDKNIKERLKYQAEHDGLTLVYNSAASRSIIDQLLKENAESPSGAMVVLDVDNFKRINDDMGHYTGDMVLTELADSLKRVFTAEDVVGRLGGDEFVIYIRGVKDAALVKSRCETVLEDFGRTTLEKHGKKISLSIGAAMVLSERDYDTLYRMADQALYRVKERGRDGVEVV